MLSSREILQLHEWGVELDETFVAVRNLAAEILQVPPDRISEDSRLIEDLRAKSLDLVEMTIAVEDEFSIDIPNEEVSAVRTIGDIVRLVEKAHA